MLNRKNLVILASFLAGATIIGRLFSLQVLSGPLYRALAQGQQKFFLATAGERGRIFFRGGQELASSQTTFSLYASPGEIAKIPVEQSIQALAVLEQILDLNPASLRQKLTKGETYALLKSHLGTTEADDVRRLNLAGLYLKEEETPFFPQGRLASATLGFVDQDGQGQYGLEGYYDAVLEGKPGRDEGQKSASGFLTAPFKNTAQKGRDLISTLDYQIQFQAQQILDRAQSNLEFEAGQIVVLDPANGEILALASRPDFDPNNYQAEKDLAVFQNPAAQKIFEPGSVFKPLTMAAAIQEGKITPQTTYVDTGQAQIGQITISNYDRRRYGKQSMTGVLEKSINTGAVFAEQQLGSLLFLQYLEKFGFFAKTGVDLPAEAFSQNKEFRKGYEINFATASFGQGIEITPLQLLRAFSALANNGRPVTPHLVREIRNEAGKATEAKPAVLDPVVSPQTANQVTAMMVSVVDNGFGKAAKIPGYFIAGKTGTAQVAWGALGVNRRGYSDKTIQSFMGFAPAYNPRFLILIKLDNPKTKTAEYSAVPLFHDLAKYLVDLWQIPPDYDIEK